jgi:hypothetical protein
MQSVVGVERSAMNVGGPLSSGCEGKTRAKSSPGIRIMSHGWGNPDTDVGRSLNEADDE